MEKKHDSQFHKIQNDINFLKNSLDDRISNSKIKREALGKSASTNTAKKGRLPIKERCADSSRVCTFFYPDHADAIIRTTNNSFPYNKTIQHVLNSKDRISSSVADGREALTGRCSDSSRFCTFYYPDHPDAIIKVTNNGSSHNKTKQQVFYSKDEKPISLNHPPRSCKELKGFGHALNGFYLVQGTLEQANKVLTIYCNFIDESSSKF